MGADPASSFVERATRFDLDSSLVFESSAGKVRGRCRNVSASGMLAAFDEPLDIWLKGRVSIVAGEWHLDLKVRVVRTEGRLAGMSFQADTDEDRSAIERLLEVAQAQSAQAAAKRSAPLAS